jgi:hypothetical protein
MNTDKKRRLAQILILVTLYSLLATFAYAKPVSSRELIENARDYDGKVITYQGEAVGDIMRRGEFAWCNVHDGSGAIGIWLPLSLAKAITFTGGYKYSGDIIEVKGTFNRACAQHGGDLDIHAESLIVVKAGSETIEPFHRLRRNLTVGLIGASICLLILRLFRRR